MLIATVTSERARAFRIFVRLLTIGAAVPACLAIVGAQRAAPGAEEADAIRAQLLARLTELQRDSAVPGGTAAIVLPDGRSFETAVGMSDATRAIAMKPGDLMMSGSTGKTFVAATTLQLVAERRLQLDDPISKWLGRSNWFDRLPNASEITVRMLLNHTSGVPDHVVNHAFIDEVFASPDRVWRPDELVRYILDQPAQSRAGAEQHYTDTNYILLGMVIESVTSSTYYVELKRRILDPLGLRHTVPSDRRRIPGLVQGYSGGAKRSWLAYGGEQLGKAPQPGSAAAADEMLVNGEFVVNPQFEWTGGGLATTTEDLARWGKAVYEGRVFPNALLEEAVRAPSISTNGRNYYGLGVSVSSTLLGLRYGHGGFYPGYRAAMAYFPEQKIAVAVLMNSTAAGTKNFSQEFIRGSRAARAIDAHPR